jgi:ribose transport system substrate-binding protein
VIRDHRDLDYAFAANEEMACAARAAFDAAGARRVPRDRRRNRPGVGRAQGRTVLRDRRQLRRTGELAVRNATALLRGRQTEEVARTPIRLITRSAADTAPSYCDPDA